MTAIRLAVFDIDGTLQDADHPLRKDTIQALRDLHQRGIAVALASSRPLTSLLKISERLGIPMAKISHNGGRAENAEGEVLLHVDFVPSPELCARLRDYVAAGGSLHVYGETWRAFGAEEAITREERGVGVNADQRHYRLPEPEELAEPALKILCHGDSPELERVRAAVIAQPLVFSQSGSIWFDIHHADSGKLPAVQRLAQHLGLAADAVASFGDSDSDAEMLAWAGLGVAIGEASEAALRGAKLYLAGPGSSELERLLEQINAQPSLYL